jgi:hypothetical protein
VTIRVNETQPLTVRSPRTDTPPAPPHSGAALESTPGGAGSGIPTRRPVAPGPKKLSSESRPKSFWIRRQLREARVMDAALEGRREF